MNAFRSAIEAGDMDAVLDLLSPDVVFRSPVVFRQYVGRDAVAPILAALGRVVDEVTYTDELSGGADGAMQALVFRALVAGKEVEGCDFLRLGQDGRIDELVVMVRPLSAALALAEAPAGWNDSTEAVRIDDADVVRGEPGPNADNPLPTIEELPTP